MIYGIGLPRTGTKSLYKALNELGYKGSFVCTLTNDADNTAKNGNPDFVINNGFYKHFNTDLKGHKVILTTRNDRAWAESMLMHGATPNISPSVYLEQVGLVTNGNLLVMDICGGEGWEPLCEFLNIDKPKTPFPNE